MRRAIYRLSQSKFRLLLMDTPHHSLTRGSTMKKVQLIAHSPFAMNGANEIRQSIYDSLRSFSAARFRGK